jgi:hypothetical protein
MSQLDLMLGSGSTSMSWKLGNALLTKKYVIHVNYSPVSRKHQKVYLVCVVMYDFLCNIFVLFMCLDVSDAVNLSCRQKTAWCVWTMTRSVENVTQTNLTNFPTMNLPNTPCSP